MWGPHIAKLDKGRWKLMARLPAGQESDDAYHPTRLARGPAGKLWVLRNGKLLESGAGSSGWRTHVIPALTKPQDVWAAARDQIWIVGERGAFRYDGSQWSRIWGLPRELDTITGRSAQDVWVAGRSGLWHGTAPAPRIRKPSPHSQASRQRVSSPARPVTAEADARAYVVTDVTVRLPSEPDLRAALGVAVDAAGGAWLYDERRLVRHDAQGTQLLASEGLRRLACHHCIAPTGADRGSSIWHGLLRELADGAWADAAGQAPDLAAVVRPR